MIFGSNSFSYNSDASSPSSFLIDALTPLLMSISTMGKWPQETATNRFINVLKYGVLRIWNIISLKVILML